MAQTTTPDWSNEIRLLRKLVPMATSVHVLAADALLKEFRRVSRKPGREHETKIFAAKLVAEAMSALEDFGALCNAVRKCGKRGIISPYLDYKPGDISKVYEKIQKEQFPWNYLKLPYPQEILEEPDPDKANVALDLDLIIGSAAKWQQVRGMVEVYNGVKHGFRVLSSSPDTENAAEDESLYFLTNKGAQEIFQLGKFRDWPERAMMVIQICAEGWRLLAGYVIFLHEPDDNL